MPKAYWIAHVTVTDPEQYPNYVEGARPAFAKYGARFLARGGRHTQFEGEDRARNVVIEFPSYEAACDCYRSDEYRAAKAKRKDAGIASVVIVEGVE
jgi:uncharacterized protein (DUF1330 family)